MTGVDVEGVHDLELWVSIAVIVVGTELSVLALIVFRRWRQERRTKYLKSPIAGDIFGVIGTGYTVILAFVIFTAFSSYQTARADVGVESVATRQMYALSAFFEAQYRDDLQGTLICYSRAVVQQEWPAMSQGQSAPVVDGWVDRLNRDMLATSVTTDKQIEAFNTWFTRETERQNGRRGRLAEAIPTIPPFVWAMLVLLFVVVIGYQVVFANPKTPLVPQVLGVSAVAATLMAGIVLVYVLDAPFADRGAQLSPFRFDSVLTQMEDQYPGPAGSIPCNDRGTPTG